MLYSYYINRYIWTYFYYLIFSVNHVFFAAASFFQNLCLSSKQYKDFGILSHWQLPLHFVVILVWIILFIIDFQLKLKISNTTVFANHCFFIPLLLLEFNFFLLEIYFLSMYLFLLNDSLAEYRILGWQKVLLRTLKILFHLLPSLLIRTCCLSNFHLFIICVFSQLNFLFTFYSFTMCLSDFVLFNSQCGYL